MADRPGPPKRKRFPAARLLSILLAVLAEFVFLSSAGLAMISNRLVASMFSSPSRDERRPPLAVVSCYTGRACPSPVFLTTSDGLILRAYVAASKNGAAVILLHGYRSSSSEMTPIADILVRHGYGVILPDFRGHGESEGEEISFGRDETVDVEAAVQYVRNHMDIDPAHIGILGNSMGAGIAILYAANHPDVNAVVVQSPYTALADLDLLDVSRSPGPLTTLLDPFLRFWIHQRLTALQSTGSLDPIRAIRQISPRPIFILMGGQDKLVDPQSGQRLYDAALDPKSLWYDPAIGHVAFLRDRPQEFEQRVVGFFDQALK